MSERTVQTTSRLNRQHDRQSKQPDGQSSQPNNKLVSLTDRLQSALLS